jgi:hypothetical protein
MSLKPCITCQRVIPAHYTNCPHCSLGHSAPASR